MFLKVCGMRDSENIRQVAALRPAMMGFIFVEKSPRFAGDILDPAVLRTLPEEIKKVAVFVDPQPEEVRQVLDRYPMDILQLHGDETEELIRDLKVPGKQIIKVIPGNREWDTGYMKAIEPWIDYWLIDTRTSVHGGTGRVFDRSVLTNYDFKRPVILSGGLDKDEVIRISNEQHPAVVGVDINSKVEDSPGVKNCDKINAVITCLN